MKFYCTVSSSSKNSNMRTENESKSEKYTTHTKMNATKPEIMAQIKRKHEKSVESKLHTELFSRVFLDIRKCLRIPFFLSLPSLSSSSCRLAATLWIFFFSVVICSIWSVCWFFRSAHSIQFTHTIIYWPAQLTKRTFLFHIFIFFFSFSRLAFCKSSLNQLQLSHLRSTHKFDFFVLFLAIWCEILTLICACSAITRTISVCLDSMSGGMARIYILGRNAPENEPWPDAIGFSIIFIVSVMFMLGLEVIDTIQTHTLTL